MRNRVGTGVPALRPKNSCSDAGTLSVISFFVAMSALANTARAPSRLNTTVFLLRPRLKCLPRMVSVSPTATSIGDTLVTTGALTFLRLAAWALGAAPAVAGAASATSAVSMAARRSGEGMRARSSIALVIGGRAGRLERPMGSLPHARELPSAVPLSTSRPSSVTTTRSSIRAPPRPGT